MRRIELNAYFIIFQINSLFLILLTILLYPFSIDLYSQEVIAIEGQMAGDMTKLRIKKLLLSEEKRKKINDLIQQLNILKLDHDKNVERTIQIPLEINRKKIAFIEREKLQVQQITNHEIEDNLKRLNDIKKRKRSREISGLNSPIINSLFGLLSQDDNNYHQELIREEIINLATHQKQFVEEGYEIQKKPFHKIEKKLQARKERLDFKFNSTKQSIIDQLNEVEELFIKKFNLAEKEFISESNNNQVQNSQPVNTSVNSSIEAHNEKIVPYTPLVFKARDIWMNIIYRREINLFNELESIGPWAKFNYEKPQDSGLKEINSIYKRLCRVRDIEFIELIGILKSAYQLGILFPDGLPLKRREITNQLATFTIDEAIKNHN